MSVCSSSFLLIEIQHSMSNGVETSACMEKTSVKTKIKSDNNILMIVISLTSSQKYLFCMTQPSRSFENLYTQERSILYLLLLFVSLAVSTLCHFVV